MRPTSTKSMACHNQDGRIIGRQGNAKDDVQVFYHAFLSTIRCIRQYVKETDLGSSYIVKSRADVLQLVFQDQRLGHADILHCSGCDVRWLNWP